MADTRTRSISDRTLESVRLSDIRALVDQCAKWAQEGIDVSCAFEVKGATVRVEASQWPTEVIEVPEQ